MIERLSPPDRRRSLIIYNLQFFNLKWRGHIHQCYRQRFGIETSYRLKNLCRIRTTTKKPTLRLLFVGISFLLVNIWVNLLWRKISQPRRGGRLIYRKLFPLKQMLSFLNQAVEAIFEVVEDVYIPLE